MRALGYLIILLLIVDTLSAQPASIQFDRKVVESGSTCQIIIRVDNARLDNYRLPSVEPFEVVSGPSRSQQTQIINGKMSSSVSLRFQCRAPEKKGKYSFQGGQLQIEGNWIDQPPVDITVVQRSSDAGAVDPSAGIMLHREMDGDSIYVGQQVTIDYVLYAQEGVQSAHLIDEPSYDRCYVQSPRLYDRVSRTAQLGGETYQRTIIRRQSVFPQFAGDYPLTRGTARAQIVTDNQSRRGFFLFNKTEPVHLDTDLDTLHVRSLPLDAPESYCGAVGEYVFKVQWDRTQLGVGDALRMQLTIEGDGDPKRIRPPRIQFPDSFKILEPELINENIYEHLGRIRAKHDYDYVLIPEVEGRYDMTIDLSWFSPDSGRYLITPIEMPEIIVGGARVSKSDGESELYGSEAEQSRSVPGWMYGLGAGLLMAGLLYWRTRRKVESTGPAIKQTSPIELAQHRLAEAKALYAAMDAQPFYTAIRMAIYRYAGELLNIPLHDLSMDRLESGLSERGVSEHLIKEVSDCVKFTEQALYAGATGMEERAVQLEKATALLSKLIALDQSS